MHITSFFLSILLLITPTIASAIKSFEIYGRLPFVSQLQLSPDGNRIAYLQEIDDAQYIVIRELFDAKKQATIFGLEKAKIRSLDWVNNQKILFVATLPYYSKGDYETFTMHRMGILDKDTNQATWPFNSGTDKYSIGTPELLNKLSGDDNHVLVAYYGEVLKISLDDGDKETHFDLRYSSDWHTNQLGKVVLFQQYDKKNDEFYWRYQSKDSEEFIPLKVENEGELKYFDDDIYLYDENTNSIVYWTQEDENLSVLMQANVADGKVVNPQLLSSYSPYDISGATFDYNTSKFNGISYITDYSEFEYFDTSLAATYADLKATFPNSEIEITSYSTDMNRFIVAVSDATTPTQFYFYDKAKSQLGVVAKSYPEVTNTAAISVKKITYQSRDGKNIESYFTTPSVNKIKALQLIVLPHGGPADRDTLTFDWIRSFFAQEGYAVFQPNFRGSAGYGKRFKESGFSQWGKDMQNDVDDGVNMLIESGQVDNHICVVGASYGGYVAQFSATNRYDMYQCAVSFAGVSDLDDLYYHAKEQLYSGSFWEKSIGERSDRENINQYSPISNITPNTLPLLLMHGEKDTTVPSFQSEKMYKALKKNKVNNVEFIKFKKEDHWFSEANSRKTFLKESLRFIKENI